MEILLDDTGVKAETIAEALNLPEDKGPKRKKEAPKEAVPSVEVKKADEIKDTDNFVTVFISHAGTDAHYVSDGGGKRKWILSGSINSKKYEVPCDEQTQVSRDIYEALSGLIEKQRLG